MLLSVVSKVKGKQGPSPMCIQVKVSLSMDFNGFGLGPRYSVLQEPKFREERKEGNIPSAASFVVERTGLMNE